MPVKKTAAKPLKPEPSVGVQRPCSNATKTLTMEGIGKVQVRIRNGYLSTGYESVNRVIPRNLRCLEGFVWVNGLTGVEIKMLRGFPMTKVIRHYREINEIQRPISRV